MAGHLTSASSKAMKKLSNKRIGIVVSDWNSEVTGALYEGACHALVASGIVRKNIYKRSVPGSFELPLAAQQMAGDKKVDAVIALGCVIRGETPHFDYICQAVAYGIMRVSLDTGKPVAFGVLTALNQSQALERAGGKLGNKGEEAAVTALRMLEK